MLHLMTRTFELFNIKGLSVFVFMRFFYDQDLGNKLDGFNHFNNFFPGSLLQMGRVMLCGLFVRGFIFFLSVSLF